MTPPRPVAPIVIRTRAAAPAKHKGKKGKRHGARRAKPIEVAIAGYVLGHIDKMGTAIPTIPILGRAGTIAVGLHFFGPKTGIWQDAAIAAAAVAGYEMGKTGSISGDVSRQFGGVQGLASQV